MSVLRYETHTRSRCLVLAVRMIDEEGRKITGSVRDPRIRCRHSKEITDLTNDGIDRRHLRNNFTCSRHSLADCGPLRPGHPLAQGSDPSAFSLRRP